MERQVLDLLLGEILGIVRLEGHAVIAHAFRPMIAHLHVPIAFDLSILLVQRIVQRCLLHHIPGVLNRRRW